MVPSAESMEHSYTKEDFYGEEDSSRVVCDKDGLLGATLPKLILKLTNPENSVYRSHKLKITVSPALSFSEAVWMSFGFRLALSSGLLGNTARSRVEVFRGFVVVSGPVSTCICTRSTILSVS